MQQPRVSHYQALKRILRYLAGTSHMGLHYTLGSLQIVGFFNVDWAGDLLTGNQHQAIVYILATIRFCDHLKSNPRSPILLLKQSIML